MSPFDAPSTFDRPTPVGGVETILSTPLRARRRVLIVKFGYGETLDPDASGVVSLGDVLRTTVLLNAFPAAQCHVTWLVDPQAAPLLANNPCIDRLVVACKTVPESLRFEHFDTVINLEKDAGLCAAVDGLRVRRRFGFRYDNRRGCIDHHRHAAEAMSMCLDHSFKRSQTRSWSSLLFGMIGKRYAGEAYVVGWKADTAPVHDIGLNHLVGSKFPLKRWPEANWRALADSLGSGFAVSWQQGQDDLKAYIRWIASCRVLITNDSLGLHIALGLGVPAVALFGPTRASEIEDSERLVKLTAPEGRSCLGCEGARCERGLPCVEGISVATVRNAALALLKQSARAA